MFFHSSSYIADPIACAAANANLAIWREEPMLARIADLGRRQGDRLGTLPAITGIRRLGTIVAVGIGGDAGYLYGIALGLLRFFRERDVLLRPLENTVHVRPPYRMSDADLDAACTAITDACDS